MKKSVYCFILLVVTITELFAQGYHRVDGYTRSNGTYVKPHYRTNPNITINDNWSTAPNINPFTGKPGTIAPDASFNNLNLLSQPVSTNSFNAPSLSIPTTTYDLKLPPLFYSSPQVSPSTTYSTPPAAVPVSSTYDLRLPSIFYSNP